MNELRWFSQFENIKKTLSNEKLHYIIVPFIQLNALKEMVFNNSYMKNCIVITRWNNEDIVSGVSDISIYPYLKEKNLKLYINKHLHLKMYTFDSKKAFLSSGNLTKTGLGLLSPGNHEIGTFHNLSDFDYKMILQLVDESTLVDDNLFGKINIYLNTISGASDLRKELNIYKPEILKFYKSPNPDYFINNYLSENFNDDIIFDMYLLSIPMDLSEKELLSLLKERICSNPLIKDIIEYIKVNTPVGIGERPQYPGVQNGVIRRWLKQKYWGLTNINDGVNSLQDWLPFCKPEINVNVTIPGRNSRVFIWIE